MARYGQHRQTIDKRRNKEQAKGVDTLEPKKVSGQVQMLVVHLSWMLCHRRRDGT
jgi:hypothetical protein